MPGYNGTGLFKILTMHEDTEKFEQCQWELD